MLPLPLSRIYIGLTTIAGPALMLLLIFILNLLNVIILIEWAFTTECLKEKLPNFPRYYCWQEMFFGGEPDPDFLCSLSTFCADFVQSRFAEPKT